MYSIKKKLSRYLSVSVSVLLVSILLATDISVDTWISQEFDRAMSNKLHLLTTLVNEDNEKVDFDFADEFMPEFSGATDPEYFQLWYDNKVFERSKTLALFDVNNLPQIDLVLNEAKIINITLPDGRSGRMIATQFIPQIDSDVREKFTEPVNNFTKHQKPMMLAYAVSNESLNQTLWFVDIIFILSSLSTVFAVHFIVYKVVERGLIPLDSLNNEIKSINLNSDINAINTDNLPEELLPVAGGINHFLKENKKLYAREKRMSSDIAHELKTPIAELINLSEVAIKFPEDKQISTTFTTDVLNISERLKSIVSSILLLQKSTNNAELTKSAITITSFMAAILQRENKAKRDVSLIIAPEIDTVITNEFALETVLTNLLSNALHYSPADSQVNIWVNFDSNQERVKFRIENTSIYQYTEQELGQFFEPLWQKDQSRTSSQRYGLGLAIVKSYCEKINAEIRINLTSKNQLSFTIIV